MLIKRPRPIKKLARIGCGCLVIILILASLGLFFSGMIIKKIITGAIQQKTGLQVQIDDLQKGKLNYTDPKTGATLNIGNNKIPDNFPKDFPIYPGSTITSSWSAGNFELTQTTKDSVDVVNSYYTNTLKNNGWTVKISTNGSYLISKDSLTGFLAISNKDNLTSILAVLGKTTN